MDLFADYNTVNGVDVVVNPLHQDFHPASSEATSHSNEKSNEESLVEVLPNQVDAVSSRWNAHAVATIGLAVIVSLFNVGFVLSIIIPLYPVQYEVYDALLLLLAAEASVALVLIYNVSTVIQEGEIHHSYVVNYWLVRLGANLCGLAVALLVVFEHAALQFNFPDRILAGLVLLSDSVFSVSQAYRGPDSPQQHWTAFLSKGSALVEVLSLIVLSGNIARFYTGLYGLVVIMALSALTMVLWFFYPNWSHLRPVEVRLDAVASVNILTAGGLYSSSV